MRFPKFEVVNSYTTFISVLLAISMGLYAFIPQLLSTFSTTNDEEVRQLLADHKSFERDGNVRGMMSFYHPEFFMEVIHSSGKRETFSSSQLSKHQELLNALFPIDVIDKSIQATLLSDKQALVSIVMEQNIKMPGSLGVKRERLYQSMLLEKHDGKVKILRILSFAEKI